MIIKSPAKVNLFLYVLNKRSDGFHEIYTLMHKIDFFDTVEVKPKPTPGIDILTTMDELNNENNLAYIAADEFFSRSGIRAQVRIEIEKRIPPGSGLGGGSSNAAATLLLLNEMFDFPLTFNELYTIAATLGSDIPFFLYDSPAAIATGRGEIIDELTCNTEGYSIFLAIPPISISTSTIYSKLVLTKKQCINKMPFVIIGERCDLEDIMPYLCNDLEGVVLKEFGRLRDIKSVLTRHFGNALLSGSGSSMFSIINPEVKADERGIEDLLVSWGVFFKRVNFSKKGR